MPKARHGRPDDQGRTAKAAAATTSSAADEAPSEPAGTSSPAPPERDRAGTDEVRGRLDARRGSGDGESARIAANGSIG